MIQEFLIVLNFKEFNMRLQILIVLFFISSFALHSQKLSVGSGNSTFLTKTDGTVLCFGNNIAGQLGINNASNQNTPQQVLKGGYAGTTYLGDNPGNKIVMAIAGRLHSLFLSESGLVYSCGSNSLGQLGDGSTNATSLPVAVLKGEYPGTTYLGDDPLNKVIAIDANYDNSIALTQDGSVYVWGKGSNGALGNNSTSNSYTPIRVLKGEYPGTNYLGDIGSNKIIAIALEHTSTENSTAIALAQSGMVYVWGYNGQGQLGNSSTSNPSLVPIRVPKGEYSGTTYLGDNSSDKIVSISATDYIVIVISESGLVYTWGENSYGELGNGTNVTSYTPVKVLKGAYSGTTYLGDNPTNKVTKVAVGTNYNLALTTDGTVYAWGNNIGYGQLGDGTTTNRNTPIKVLKGSYAGTANLGDNSANKIVDIGIGGYHSLAMSADGLVYAWGAGGSGQAGQGGSNYAHNITPVTVLVPGGALPVELVSFSASVNNETVQLKWQTATEIDNYGFEVEKKSVNSESLGWETIGFVQGNGNSNSTKNYSFADASVVGKVQYRLKQLDVDGNFVYSHIIEVDASRALEFFLSQNYPNPFNPSTVISYTLAEAGVTKLSVYDVLGNEVAQLVNGVQASGTYSVDFEATNLSGGVYFYKLESGSKALVKKLLLLK